MSVYKKLNNVKLYNRNGERIDSFGGDGGNNGSSSPQNDYVQSSDLAGVAFAGSYRSLYNLPIAVLYGIKSVNGTWHLVLHNYNSVPSSGTRKFLVFYDFDGTIGDRSYIVFSPYDDESNGTFTGTVVGGANGLKRGLSVCTYDCDNNTFAFTNLNYNTLISAIPELPNWVGNSKPTYSWSEIIDKPTISRTIKLEKYVSYVDIIANTNAPGLYRAENIDTSVYNVLLCVSNISLYDVQYMSQRDAIRIVHPGGNQDNATIDSLGIIDRDSFEIPKGVYFYKIVSNTVYIKTIEQVLKEYYKGALFANTVLSRVIYVDAAEWNEIQLDIDTFKDSNNRIHTKGHHLIYFEKDTKYHKYNSVPSIQINISGTTYFLNYKMNSFTFNTSSERIKAGLYEFSIDATDVILKPYGLINAPHSIINDVGSASFEHDYYFDDVIKLSNSNITLGTTKIREGKEIKVYSIDATSTCNGVVIGENEYKEFTFIDNAWRLRT